MSYFHIFYFHIFNNVLFYIDLHMYIFTDNPRDGWLWEQQEECGRCSGGTAEENTHGEGVQLRGGQGGQQTKGLIIYLCIGHANHSAAELFVYIFIHLKL